MSSRRRASDCFSAAVALLLAGAIGFQFIYSLREAPQPTARARIADVVPRSVEGWIGTKEALGSTEAVNAATLKILNLDDYVYRRFQRGSVSFTVYAAYWAPGRMPTRLVASHTPDRCWTENGMRCVDMKFRQSNRIGARPLLPAEYRVFTAGGSDTKASVRESAGSVNGRPPTSDLRPLPSDYASSTGKTFVLYWHTVEGKLYDYGERFNAVPSPWLWWKDTLAQAAYGSREQLFVRIASETPLEQLWREPGFEVIMKSVAALGLFAEK
jgi:hypothetical protein